MEKDNPPKPIERLLADLRSAIRDDLDGAKRDILDRIREVETSVETIARELARSEQQ